MNMRVIVKYDENENIVVFNGMEKQDGVPSIKVKEFLNKLNIDKCIVQVDVAKNTLTLKEKDDTYIKFKGIDIVDREEFYDISEIIMYAVNKNGWFYTDDVYNITSKPKKGSKYKNTLINKVIPFTLASTIVIGGLSYIASAKRKRNDSLKYTTYQTSQVHDDKISIGNIFYNEDKNEVFINNEEIISPVSTNLTNSNTNQLVTDNGSILRKDLPVIEHSEGNGIYLDYEDRSGYDKAVMTRGLYYDVIEKCAKKYGLDPELVLCIATQERGTHSTQTDRGGGVGLMQIQYNVWIGHDITYYSLNNNGEFEKHTLKGITDSMIRNLDSNVELACMVLQECLRNAKYNIPAAIQMYNMGQGTIGKIISKYANSIGMEKSDVLANPNDLGWLKYRQGYPGDPDYLEHVVSYSQTGEFTVTDVRTLEDVSVKFVNEDTNEMVRSGRR